MLVVTTVIFAMHINRTYLANGYGYICSIYISIGMDIYVVYIYMEQTMTDIDINKQ